MKTLKQLQADFEAKSAELDAAIAENNVERAAALDGELEEIKSQLLAQKSVEEIKAKQAERQAWYAAPATPAPAVPETPKPEATKTFAIPRMRGLHFRDDSQFTAAEKAYGLGSWFLASLGRSTKAVDYCKSRGIPFGIKAQTEGSNPAGGFLVPPVFEPDMIDIREQYGVFRPNAKVKQMTAETLTVPRRTGGVTAYFVGETEEITESQKGWDTVMLMARKLAVLTKVSSELSEDATISLGNDLAYEINYAFAQKEDECGFLGDGTSTYGSILGIIPGLQKTVTDAGGTWTTDSHKIYNPSIVVAAGNAFSEVTMANITAVAGNVHAQATRRGQCKWYCNQVFFYEVMLKLALAQGGATAREASDGIGQARPIFLGYPVEFTQCMIAQEANSGVPLLFGDLWLSSLFGDRRVSTIALSEHLNFAEDEIAIRGTERFDIQNHDLGTASSTAASRLRSPIAALALANS